MVGGGQLARMTHQAAVSLGQSLRVLARGPDEPAALVAPDVVLGDHRDLDALRRAARGAEVLTFDHEHVPGEHLEVLVAEGHAVHPGPAALRHAQDKLVMRTPPGRAGGAGAAVRAGRLAGRRGRVRAEQSWPWCSRRCAAATTAAGCGCSTGPRTRRRR
ncbi:hypothetical protein L7F22_037070 [Adiantum nelumboides]|nr:hypothetical protein [Adiantum nelumboides]